MVTQLFRTVLGHPWRYETRERGPFHPLCMRQVNVKKTPHTGWYSYLSVNATLFNFSHEMSAGFLYYTIQTKAKIHTHTCILFYT